MIFVVLVFVSVLYLKAKITYIKERLCSIQSIKREKKECCDEQENWS